jgi:DNA invertase Pin-like site-specific DNA recombinase
MNAAIYARKSSSQEHVSEDAKSVTRQVEGATAFAASRGWSVAHVFTDEISGAEFGASRPGLETALVAAERGDFTVLVVAALDRMGREQIETAFVLKKLARAGVAVYCYSDGREVELANARDKALLTIQAMGGELEREQARIRTRHTLQRKAQQGFVAGGIVFGYRNQRVAIGHVDRVIHEDEACIVRRIFERSADGWGLSRIARTLNDEHVPAPRGDKRPHGRWTPSTVRSIVLRPLYVGEVTWGRTKKRDTWGQANRSDRPEDTWTRAMRPELAIVSRELWDVAQQRFATRRARFAQPRRADLGSSYLLSGFATCGVCDGTISVHSRPHGRQGRRHFYACARHWKGGAKACATT